MVAKIKPKEADLELRMNRQRYGIERIQETPRLTQTKITQKPEEKNKYQKNVINPLTAELLKFIKIQICSLHL